MTLPIYLRVLSTTLVVGFVVKSSAANLLNNPGFATPPDPATDWSLTLGAARGTYSSPPGSHDGDSAVLMFRADQTPENGWASASQTFAAAPGQEWTLSGWALYPSGMYLYEGDYAWLDITFSSGSGQKTSIHSSQVNLAVESTWMQLSQTAVAPADTTQVTLSAEFYHGTPWVSGRLYFDDFSASATPIPEPGLLNLLWPVLLLLMKKRMAQSQKC